MSEPRATFRCRCCGATLSIPCAVDGQGVPMWDVAASSAERAGWSYWDEMYRLCPDCGEAVREQARQQERRP